VVVALAFSPNTQLVQALVPAALVAALTWNPPSDAALRQRLTLLFALVVPALMLPMAAMGRDFTGTWNLVGAPSWLLLTAYVAMVPLVLARIRPQARGADRAGKSGPVLSSATSVDQRPDVGVDAGD
jgi:hypothetical protein